MPYIINFYTLTHLRRERAQTSFRIVDLYTFRSTRTHVYLAGPEVGKLNFIFFYFLYFSTFYIFLQQEFKDFIVSKFLSHICAGKLLFVLFKKQNAPVT